MHEDDIVSAILLEHGESVPHLLLSLLAVGASDAEIAALGSNNDPGASARALVAHRRRRGLPPCHLDLHSLVVLGRYQILPLRQLCPPPQAAAR